MFLRHPFPVKKRDILTYVYTCVKSYLESIAKAGKKWKLHAWDLHCLKHRVLWCWETHMARSHQISSALLRSEKKKAKTFRWLNRTLGNVIIYTTVQKFGVGKILQGILSPTILPSLPKCHQKPCETLHCCLCWRLFGRSAWKEMCWRNRPWQCGP